MSTVGIIPAAGHGTRLQPRDCSKEVYLIGGRPVMDYEIDRLRQAPCDELRVVTRPEKRDVIENAERHGATVIEAHPPSLGRSVYAGIEGLPDETVVLFGFPDSIWEPVDGYRLLLEFFHDGDWEVALGLLRAPDMTREEPVVYDERSGRVGRLEFKPEHPSADRTWACALSTAGVLHALSDEDEPGRLFNGLCSGGRVGALALSAGMFLDMGTARGLEHTLASLAARPG